MSPDVGFDDKYRKLLQFGGYKQFSAKKMLSGKINYQNNCVCALPLHTSSKNTKVIMNTIHIINLNHKELELSSNLREISR